MLNPYINNYTVTSEQNLTDSLIIESIQFKGLNIKYLPRTHNNYNFLYGEDPTSSFNEAIEIEMYLQDVNGFGGDGELLSKFGLMVKDTATFIVSKTRFKEEFPTFIRPKEGDLLFMPITNAILEIKFVNLESPFFQQGKQYVYELKVETFEFSQEEIVTQDVDIDDLVNSIMVQNPETEVEPYGKNDEIEQRADNQTILDPRNPFGVK